jgi:hypothetical protein
MSESATNFETLDLRFRVVPQKASGAWLPGGVWLWFLIGASIGVGGWVYGRNELKARLSKQISSASKASTSLFALEALESLQPESLDHLVTGLHHTDPRVARSAYQKINLHIDQWASADTSLQFAAMKSLATQLQRVPERLPEANLMLVRSVAARLYSSSVSIDDPQVKPVTEICQRLLAIAGPPPQIPPSPLPPIDEPPALPADVSSDSTTQTSSIAEPQSIHRSSSNPVASLRLVASPTRPRASESTASEANNQPSVASGGRRNSQFRLSDNNNEASGQLSDNTATASLADNSQVEDAVNSVAQKPELPLVVATPALIASYPVASLKTVTNQPNLAGIEKLEIAELIRLLAHENADVAKAAALGLRYKGLSDSKIQLASELATGSANRRLELIQQIATSGDMDPRPWLVWMGEDGQPEVRKMAIALLIPMADESVYRSLRNLSARESDSHIKEMITRALLSASK